MIDAFKLAVFGMLLASKTPDYLNDPQWKHSDGVEGKWVWSFDSSTPHITFTVRPNIAGRRNFDRVWARYECQRQGPAKTPTFRL